MTDAPEARGVTGAAWAAAVVPLAFLLAGCAGRNFVRIPDAELVLGETTPEGIAARLGTPYREGTITKNDQAMKTVTYAYASAGGESDAGSRVIPARSQAFYFFENRLVGYEFTSSFKADSSDFDAAKALEIKRGESTREDVVRLLGIPGGAYIHPVIPGRDGRAVSYVYSRATRPMFGQLKFYQKQLVITFDARGIVTNVECVESGDK